MVKMNQLITSFFIVLWQNLYGVCVEIGRDQSWYMIPINVEDLQENVLERSDKRSRRFSVFLLAVLLGVCG